MMTVFDAPESSVETEVTTKAADTPRAQRRWNFQRTLRHNGIAPLKRSRIRDLQVNLGKLCNQACSHCHVDAGPKRTEIMTLETMHRILEWIGDHRIATVDITGGAPEMNPHFRFFVDQCLQHGANVIVRSNLTILLEPGYTDLPEWYAERKVALICSLPCYSKENVDQQRGKGIFNKSIRALQLLNQCGYGIEPELTLDLAYNPNGAMLPPPQQNLEADYKVRLLEDFGIRFNNLFTLTNLPISRFRHYLDLNNEYDEYMQLLARNFNPETVSGLMCRHILSVDWNGRIFDCDFNQILDMHAGWRSPAYLWNTDYKKICSQSIAVDSHCFGCTAGAGSSCGGSLV